MRFLHRPGLAREISLVLTIKLILLTGLWFAFFRDPPPQTGEAVGQHILSGDRAPRSNEELRYHGLGNGR